jgi:hypothetical protein
MNMGELGSDESAASATEKASMRRGVGSGEAGIMFCRDESGRRIAVDRLNENVIIGRKVEVVDASISQLIS